VTDSPATDLPVPGQAIGFGPATAAQARGDFEVLVQRGRRALRLHLDGPAAERLPALADTIDAAAVA
jgi:transaldolase/glucose-6-phosphate isomerase